MPETKPHRVFVKTGDGRDIPVRLHLNPRASRISVRIDQARREAVATAPHPAQAAQALAFARQRADWIATRLDALPVPLPFAAGVTIPFRGAPLRLEVSTKGSRARYAPGPPATLAAPAGDGKDAPDRFAARVRAFLRTAARTDLCERVAVHARTLGVTPTSISIKDTRSRWGSCSATGALAFSWRLVLAPPAVLDYVAAHECAHLIELNHSDRFWKQVARCTPDWRTTRKWLKENGSQLHLVGGPAPTLP